MKGYPNLNHFGGEIRVNQSGFVVLSQFAIFKVVYHVQMEML